MTDRQYRLSQCRKIEELAFEIGAQVTYRGGVCWQLEHGGLIIQIRGAGSLLWKLQALKDAPSERT